MAILVKLNVQTRLDGVLLGVGLHDKDKLSDNAFKTVEQYVAEQRALPLAERHLPPYFEIIDTEAKFDNQEQKLENKQNAYMGMKQKELRDLCKTRGIEYKNTDSNAKLIELLIADDEDEIGGNESTSYFKDSDEFLALSANEQIDYLEEIFGLPDDIDEDSDEAQKYSDELVETVTMYSALSLEDEVVEKVKEILDYYEE